MSYSVSCYKVFAGYHQMGIRLFRGIYHYRKQIHQSIRHIMPSPWNGKTEIVISLKTDKKSDAKKLAEAADEHFIPIIQGCFELLGKGHTNAAASLKRRLAAMMAPPITQHTQQNPATVPSLESHLIYAPPPAPPAPKGKKTVKEVFDAYIKDTKLTQTTAVHWQGAWETFLGLVGLDWTSPMTKVTDDACILFREQAVYLPARPNRAIYKGKSYLEQIALVKESIGSNQPLETIKNKSVNDKLAAISAVCNYAIPLKYISTNPTINLRLSEDDGIDREIYDENDIKNIFSHQVFKKPRSQWCEKQWVTICGTMGMRANEIAQLLVEDIREINGIPCIILSELNLKGDRVKKLKNKPSWRTVPIHKDIIELGFIDYIKRINETGSIRLFPDAKHHRGNYAHGFSKWYGLQRDAFNIHSPTKVFHCFRHTFKTLCSRFNIQEAFHDTLTGHAQPSESRGYIHPTIGDLKTAMDKVDFGLLKIIK